MQRTVVVGADWTLLPWRHNSSNVGSVAAGQVRHNSSYNNYNNFFYKVECHYLNPTFRLEPAHMSIANFAVARDVARHGFR